MEFLLKSLMFLTAVFLILLVLVQRGRGGGLAGALGGMGGQSAFGTKAGDLFTRITIGVAAVWIVLSCFAVWYFSATANDFGSTPLGTNAPQTQTSPPTKPGTSGPAEPAKNSGPAGAPATTAPATTAPATTAPATSAPANGGGKATPPAATPPATSGAAPTDGKAEPVKK